VNVIRRVAHFWYDFIVGDDWRLAIGVVLAVGFTYVAAHHGIDAWWLLPVVVATVLSISVYAATRPARRS
jgi:hypothetical protein